MTAINFDKSKKEKMEIIIICRFTIKILTTFLRKGLLIERLTILLLIILPAMAKSQQTIFEKSNGKATATYFEAIQFYKELALHSSIIKFETKGFTDAGYPLNLILISADKDFDPDSWHRKHKVTILINNGIHPGEPDGIDANMILVRDIINKKIKLPGNVGIAVIPVYNIGGALNRNSFSRVNQDGPESYGFRGNAQNLDLNRDFTKCDSKNARSFAQIFHFLNPDILIDTHVSDGADYQHTMTLITTQYDKLGQQLGAWVKGTFEPALYKGMKTKNWDMVPYVNVEDSDPSKGFSMFYDSPRYSSGYAALFNTISFMPETQMLKPYKKRVQATYDLLNTMIQQASIHAKSLLAIRKAAIENTALQKSFPLSWKLDTNQSRMVSFEGYQSGFKTSKATGLPVLFYDHTKPYSKEVKYYDTFLPENIVRKAKEYIIPQGWWKVIDLLKLNDVKMTRLKRDTIMEVNVYHIADVKSLPYAYEKHHKNFDVAVTSIKEKIQFLKGDYVIKLNQSSNRYITEMLEPTGDDSFFSWNFFDAILQRKEGYSDYRWDDVATQYLKKHPDLQQKLEAKKKSDSAFAKSASEQLSFIYKNSPWFEPEYLRYPVYRLDNDSYIPAK
ncbi:MAG: M14 family metallopeptidase [Ginsengibacter sp.]